MIAVCGEALVDLVPTDDTAAMYAALPGGSPANTAVALARLGLPTLLLARLSDDGFGRLLRAHLQTNGVDLARAVPATERSTLAIVSLGADGAAAYRFDVSGTADWQWTAAELGPLPTAVRAIHAGSLALALAPGSLALEAFLVRERPRCTISVDPNLRPSLTPDLDAVRTAVQRWLAIADIVKASTEDLELLHPGEDPIDVARRWAAAGPAVVVVTCAEAGAFGVVRGEVISRPAVPTIVVDTVGAGDTFTAGLLEQLDRAGQLGSRLDHLTAADVAAALDRGLRAAAVTCSRPGADPPWAAEL